MSSMKCTTSERLQTIMDERNLRQADILAMVQPICKEQGTTIQRNALSQYVTGKVLPRQDKLTALAHALNVSEAWLMGYDVPMERTTRADTDERVLTAYHGAEEVYQTIALELLESHQKELNVPDQDGKG